MIYMIFMPIGISQASLQRIQTYEKRKNTNYESLRFALFPESIVCVRSAPLFPNKQLSWGKNGIILVKRYFPEKVFFNKSPFTDNTY